MKTIKIYGDFLGFKGTKILESQLVNQPYNYQTINQLLNESQVKAVFGSNFTKDEIVRILIK
ncbi:lipoate protein ligase C-terminal domain-containing protein [Spiroplasma attinicola]|uniref:lipoate protein ligase C-terminal domain-containing protein n=1 Tax=Spiroplasma attinicola TaxID=2904537 RepID=UPI0035BE93BC